MEVMTELILPARRPHQLPEDRPGSHAARGQRHRTPPALTADQTLLPGSVCSECPVRFRRPAGAAAQDTEPQARSAAQTRAVAAGPPPTSHTRL